MVIERLLDEETGPILPDYHPGLIGELGLVERDGEYMASTLSQYPINLAMGRVRMRDMAKHV